MNSPIIRLILVFCVYVFIFVLVKPVFLLIHGGEGLVASDYFDVIANGLSMDMSIAAYLSVVPGLLLTAVLWTRRRWALNVLKWYFGAVALIIGIIIVLDMVLYSYWGFRIDTTPMFYLRTSPAAALASATWQHVAGGILAIAGVSAGVYAFTARYANDLPPVKRRGAVTAVLVVLIAALFLPARGGITVSTMNPGRAYYSSNQRLNHAAINPVFNLMYSATHSDKLSGYYRFTDEEQAMEAFAELRRSVPDSLGRREVLAEPRPDIYLIILESFSAHLMPSMGGDSVAMRLDSLASRGLLFTGFYASSFRTDRALPAILNGIPAQPSTSIMKYVDKVEALPAIADDLKSAGYRTEYYYGGDINFTNMKALLVAGGYDMIVSDKDFPISEKASKWGAHDDRLFARVLQTVAADTSSAPALRVVQTSSSHEPFNVPYNAARFADSPQKNAFAYTDSCLGSFVRETEAMQPRRPALFVIVPDHLGAWPLGLDNALERHHVPLLLYGDALGVPPERINASASQPDIAPTLLAMLGLPTDRYIYGNDLFDPAAPRYSFFSEPGLAALVTPTDTLVYACDAGEVQFFRGTCREQAERYLKSYLQTLYTDLSNLP